MANTASALKRIRQNSKRRARNVNRLSRLRTVLRRAREAIQSGDKAKAIEATRLATSSLARGAQKGLIHKNVAARTTSRLTLKIKNLEK